MSRRRRDPGSASLELLALVPIALTVALLTLQAGAAAYTAISAQEAARTAARAASLDQDPAAAARAALPGTLRLVSLTTIGPTGHGVRLVVEVPDISPLRTFQVTRQAVLP